MARCKQLSCSRNDTPSPQTTETYRTPGQEPVGPHRELRCPPGTYFSPRSLRSNPSDLEENAVLDHKVRPRHRAQPRPRHLPHQPRTHTPRTEHATGSARRGHTTRPADYTPGAVLSPCGASSWFSQPGPPHAHPRVRQGCLTHTHASVKAASRTLVRPSGAAPRTCQALRVRPRRSTGPDSTGSLPSRSQESPSQQPRTLENPSLSGGTSGRYWAASAVSLRAYRRPSGQSLWDSWTPCPTCGVCVTTTLPRCPNGVRDH